MAGSSAGSLLSAGRVLDGTNKVYYAPNQLMATLPQVYEPPTQWPQAGMLAKIPKCVRFLYPRNEFTGGTSDARYLLATSGGTLFGQPDNGYPTPQELIDSLTFETAPFTDGSTAFYDALVDAGATTGFTQFDDGGGTFTVDLVAYMENPDFDPDGGDESYFARVAAGLEVLESDSFVYVWGVEYDEENYLALLAPPSGLTDYFTTNVLQIVIARRSPTYLDSGEPAAEYVAARAQIAEHYGNFPGYAAWLYADDSDPGDDDTEVDENIAFMGSIVAGSGAYAGIGLSAYGFSYGGTADWNSTTAADFLPLIRAHFGL